MLDDHAFRREFARLLAALVRTFGVENVALAEDVVQETLANAFEAWSYEGVPPHYSALLMVSAKNRAIDAFRRYRTVRRLGPELGRYVESEWTLRPAIDAMFLPDALRDDELRMMFTCCTDRLDEDVQVALALNLLCGFSAAEIASAFLITTAAAEKRLARGKKVLAESRRIFELTAQDFVPRLGAVHRALYLLFNEGYHAASADHVVRAELCREAMRLADLLIAHGPAATPTTLALGAMMHLHAARLPARLDSAGELTALVDQDRDRWDPALIASGLDLLAGASTGSEISAYHAQAGIAACHAAASCVDDTRWDEIVALYDVLMRLEPSPVVALGRAMAIAQLAGPQAGLDALRSIEHPERLARYPFYQAALGELELRRGRLQEARGHFAGARALARNEAERRYLDQKIACTAA